ncbi:MAG: acyl-CoA dehydrogenase family protein [Acidimicrobiia bacterium]
MVDELLLSTAEKVFGDTCTFEAIEAAEANGWAPEIWRAVAQTGLPWISVPESAGGSGGSLADALAVVQVAARYGAPIPIAETGLLAGWLLASAGLPIGEGVATVVPGNELTFAGGRLNGVAHQVAWASAAERIVVLIDGQVASVATSAVSVERRPNLAGEPRDTVTFDNVTPEAVAPTTITRDQFMRRGALTRIALTAGAIGRMSELTIQYTTDRKQFGQAVRRFQLVQAHLVHLAQDAQLVSMALQAAVAAVEAGAGDFEIAAAKAIAANASLSSARLAHQAHGAMGMTREYPLHHLTRRVWAWRPEYGDEGYWNRIVMSTAVDTGADRLYGLIANGSRPNNW